MYLCVFYGLLPYQIIGYFNFLTCLFRLVSANIVHADPAAISPDIGRYHVQMRMAAVMVLI